jgi:hypothetical protein
LGEKSSNKLNEMARDLLMEFFFQDDAAFANAEFLERHDRSASTRTDLLLELQEAALWMTGRLDSLLQFGSGERNNLLIRERVSQVLEKAVEELNPRRLSKPEAMDLRIAGKNS